jgi:acyl-CoA hydrolase
MKLTEKGNVENKAANDIHAMHAWPPCMVTQSCYAYLDRLVGIVRNTGEYSNHNLYTKSKPLRS